jgi:hypothetical protein
MCVCGLFVLLATRETQWSILLVFTVYHALARLYTPHSLIESMSLILNQPESRKLIESSSGFIHLIKWIHPLELSIKAAHTHVAGRGCYCLQLEAQQH